MKRLSLIILILPLLLVSCKKNELKKPTDVQFDIVMESDDTPNPLAYLTFTNGHVNLGKVVIDGKRVEGDPVLFTRDYSSGLYVSLNTSAALEDLRFDIPQGTYNSFELEYETFSQGTEKAIVIDGLYENQSQQNVPFRFEFNAVEDFPLLAVEDGNNQIVLDKNTTENPLISLNPGFWFQTVSINLWENANLYDVEGTQTILITSNKNEDIYDEVLDQIEESGELEF